MINERQLVQVFRITRHDWLNQLQLIKANLSLNRTDRINELINHIVTDAQMEANLTNFKAEQLTAYVLLHKTLETNFPLVLDVKPLSIDLSKEDEAIAATLATLIDKIKDTLRSATLYLSIYQDDGEVCLSLHLLLDAFKDEQQLEQLKVWSSAHESEWEVFEDHEALFFNLIVNTTL